jgi:alginate O-acetyltransferase complex protein AlgI
MLFIDPVYLFVFVPLVGLGFYLIGRQTPAILFLTAASLVFYAGFGADYLAVFVSSMAVNAAFAWALLEHEGPARRPIFLAGIGCNIAFIFYFKYWGYLGSFGAGAFDVADLAIPVGISFYTFQQMGFLFDLYSAPEPTRRQLGYGPTAAGRARALSRFLSYVAFFPQLVIGPIVYLHEYVAQIERPTFGRLRSRDLAVGVTLLILGLCKKVLADQLGTLADPTFAAAADGSALSRFDAWVGALAYFAQLYFDFSGYSDMALGAARLFGIRLPINFDSPLRATGIVDFYRRWHITLTRLIARFLFTPLALWATRLAARRRYTGWRMRAWSSWLPFLANFQAIALWHGLSPTFILFGAIHGVWFILERELGSSKAMRRLTGRLPERSRFLLAAAATFLPLMLTFALFRSTSLASFGRLLEAMFTGPNGEIALGRDHLVLVAAFAIIWLLPNTNVLLKRFNPGLITWINPDRTPALFDLSWRPSFAWGVIVLILFSGALYHTNYEAPFLYLGF